MNDLIKRYVYDVTRRLPEKTREEVAKELNANIADMLPAQPSEADIKKVLTGLGEPRELASGYRPTQRYLISPKWMDEYLQTLKIVLIIFGTISLVFGLLDHILNPTATTTLLIIAEAVGNTISEVIQSFFRAFAIVTLVFAALDFAGTKGKKEPWSPEKLPQLPKANVKKISKVESIVGIVMAAVFGTIWAYLLYNNQFYIWTEAGNPEYIVIALFSDAIVQIFVPLFIASVVITIGDHLVKFNVGHWNLATAVSHTFKHLFSIALFIAFVTQPNLFDAAFIDRIATFFEINAAEITTNFTNAMTGIAALVSILTAIDLISTWVKALKPTNKAR